ncbi:2-amino-4-hydroxy-6-hydroxymethyldihydropteridine diphosphokinase [Marinilabilia salmonicolor]|uniref:2-amino-4-hydroxy-6- hydroxymethyldihydropteridine diphosphokinase n=1 Tax=Marinilabilia salmonicolor TaxID=989 RepID=UPI00029A17F5|nr:2-amino-4-hydroxy-6-hydroxymethyldihydropteridine diphosphokinase [Marinilabilia salmonicolor]
MSNETIIALGSNIDAQHNIGKAIDQLQTHFQLRKVAGPIVTSPIGITDQPDFLNAVALIQTALSIEELVSVLKKIENEMGRDRSRAKFGPREIDLDVLIWNGEVVDDDYYERDFLRQLVAELK